MKKLCHPFRDWITHATIKKKMILFFSCTIIFTQCLSGLVAYVRSTRLLTEQFSNQKRQSLLYIDDHIQSVLNHASWISNLVFSNKTIQDQLRHYKSETMRPESGISEVNNVLLNMSISSNDINSIALFASTGQNFMYGNISGISIHDVTSTDWYRKAIELDGQEFWQNIYESSLHTTLSEKAAFHNIRAIKDFQKHDIIGVLVVSIKESTISDIYKEIQEASEDIFVISATGKIISCADSRQLGTSILSEEYYQRIIQGENAFSCHVNGKEQFVNWISSSMPDWYIVSTADLSQIKYEIRKTSSYILLVTLLCIALSAIIVVSIATAMTKPLTALTDIMQKAEEGDLTVRAIHTKNMDETGSLAVHFNSMISRIQVLIDEVSEERSKRNLAQFEALRAQINPHFLYNTLESINSIAKLNGNEDISRIVISLSQILRNSIAPQKGLVTLQYEIEQFHNYLTIQQIRSANEFTVCVDIPDEMLHLKVLNFILQPIVENAIYHGLESNYGNGRLTLSGYVEDDVIHLCVQDNGGGIALTRLDEIRKNLANTDILEKPQKSHGIYNVNDRIRIYFGTEYGVSIESIYGNGTSVSITMPATEEKTNV